MTCQSNATISVLIQWPKVHEITFGTYWLRHGCYLCFSVILYFCTDMVLFIRVPWWWLVEHGNVVCDWSSGQEHEVVPLFGDVVIGPFNYVEKTANYDPQHWPRCLYVGASQQATVLNHMSEYRQQHAELMCELMLLSDQRRTLVEVNIVAAV